MKRGQKLSGFTIVELLIVIVVIAILAAISIVAYNGIQQRTRDSIRAQDASSIIKALEYYRLQNNAYPEEKSGSWDTSIAYPSNFIEALSTSGAITPVPVDPQNNSQYFYQYYQYAAGSYSCDSSKGNFYVFIVRRGEASTKSPASPGFSCPGRNWSAEGWYVAGGYTED